MKKYEKLVSFIIVHVGGKENIENVTHCMTRLRFKLKDQSKVDEKALKENKEIVTAQSSGGRYQVVIGTHVADVCEEVLRQLNMESMEIEEKEKGSLINRLTATITQTMVPVLGVLCACCLIGGVLATLLAFGVVDKDDGAYLSLNAMGNACLTFFPILLGYTSAKAFKMNPFVGMILGCILVFPNLMESIHSGNVLYTFFEGSSMEMPVYKTFFGIPILFPENGYTFTVIPIIFATYFAAKVEKFFSKIIPQVARMHFVPMFTILIAGTVSLLVIGPVSIILTNLINTFVTFLLAKSPVIAFAVIALIYQPLVILGLHWALVSISVLEFAASGSTLIMSLIFPASFAHMAVCAAVYFKTKNKQMKETAIPAIISACFCIIEPSIYGITLPVKKRFGICMISGTIGSVILGIANVPMFAAASAGIASFASFINPATGESNGVLMSLFAVCITMATAFGLTCLTYRAEDDMGEAPKYKDSSKEHKKEILDSPMSGTVKNLSEMDDEAFSTGGMGKGVCISPFEGKVIAPCDGILSVVFPDGHALGITSEHGAEILIHIGINTVQLPEGTFCPMKNQGSKIKKGEVLLTFDLDGIKRAGYDTDTAVVISNSSDYLDIINTQNGKISYGEELLTTLVSENRGVQVSNAGA